jgi:hypothetical protein
LSLSISLGYFGITKITKSEIGSRFILDRPGPMNLLFLYAPLVPSYWLRWNLSQTTVLPSS